MTNWLSTSYAEREISEYKQKAVLVLPDVHVVKAVVLVTSLVLSLVVAATLVVTYFVVRLAL